MVNVSELGQNATEHVPWWTLEPEYALVASVLRKAVQDAVHKPTTRQRVEQYCGHYAKPETSNEAMWWIFSEDAGPFSCRWCCDVMDIDVNALRYALKHKPASVWRLVNQKQWGVRDDTEQE